MIQNSLKKKGNEQEIVKWQYQLIQEYKILYPLRKNEWCNNENKGESKETAGRLQKYGYDNKNRMAVLERS